MAAVQNNEASTQARVTSSSAKVKEQKCFVCKKQFGASDIVLRLPCNHKSCLTCMSEEEAEKLHAKQPISCRLCKRHVSKMEMTVNSRTLLKREENFCLFLQSLFDLVIIAVDVLLALIISCFNNLFSSLSDLWVNIKSFLQSLKGVTAENLTMVWEKMKQCTSHFFTSFRAVFSELTNKDMEEYEKVVENLNERMFAPSEFGQYTCPKLCINVFDEIVMGILYTIFICLIRIILLTFISHADPWNYFQDSLVTLLFDYFSWRACIIINGRAIANIVYIVYYSSENMKLALEKLFETFIKLMESLVALFFGALVFFAHLIVTLYILNN